MEPDVRADAPPCLHAVDHGRLGRIGEFEGRVPGVEDHHDTRVAEYGLNGGGDGNRTRVQGFAGPCLSHSATPPQERASPAANQSRSRASERTTGFEPATLTLAR
jgi:hypothetical protein